MVLSVFSIFVARASEAMVHIRRRSRKGGRLYGAVSLLQPRHARLLVLYGGVFHGLARCFRGSTNRSHQFARFAQGHDEHGGFSSGEAVSFHIPSVLLVDAGGGRIHPFALAVRVGPDFDQGALYPHHVREPFAFASNASVGPALDRFPLLAFFLSNASHLPQTFFQGFDQLVGFPCPEAVAFFPFSFIAFAFLVEAAHGEVSPALLSALVGPDSDQGSSGSDLGWSWFLRLNGFGRFRLFFRHAVCGLGNTSRS